MNLKFLLSDFWSGPRLKFSRTEKPVKCWTKEIDAWCNEKNQLPFGCALKEQNNAKLSNKIQIYTHTSFDDKTWQRWSDCAAHSTEKVWNSKKKWSVIWCNIESVNSKTWRSECTKCNSDCQWHNAIDRMQSQRANQ